MILKPLSLDDIFKLKADGDHAIFAPSASKMWLTCAGSLIPNLLATDTPTIEAAYGTVVHEIAELWLRLGVKPKHLLGVARIVDGFEILIDEEAFYQAQRSVDRFALLPGQHLVEKRVYFSRLMPVPRQGGTLDFAALQVGHGIVGDHKFGLDVVYAEANTQLMLYALGLFDEWDWLYGFQSFRLMINQPRKEHFDEWEVSRDALMEFAGYVRERARLAWSLDAPRTPSPDACQYCKVRSTCAANALMEFRLMAEATEAAFREVTIEQIGRFKDDIDDEELGFLPAQPKDPHSLSTTQLAKLKPYRRMAARWWEAVEAELLKRYQAGESMPLKLVEGKSNRYFRDEQEAASHLISLGCAPSDVRKTKTVSPSEAEDLLVKAGHRRKNLPLLLKDMTSKPRGKPTLVPLHDKRPALVDLEGVEWDAGETVETDDM